MSISIAWRMAIALLSALIGYAALSTRQPTVSETMQARFALMGSVVVLVISLTY